MHLWNLKTVLTEVKENALKEKEKAQYYLATMLVQFVVFLFIGQLGSAKVGAFIILSYMLGALVTFYGVIHCFAEVKRENNQSFIERMVIIGLPVTVRVFSLFLGLGFVMAYLSFAYELHSIFIQIYTLLSVPAFYALLFYVLRNQLRNLSVEANQSAQDNTSHEQGSEPQEHNNTQADNQDIK